MTGGLVLAPPRRPPAPAGHPAALGSGHRLSLLTVAATVLGLVALDQQREVSDQRDRALSRELAAKSETLGARDPVLAKLLSVAAWRVSLTVDARAAMLRVAAQPAHRRPAVNSVAFSPDGSLLATAGADNMVRLWDVSYTMDVVGSLCTGARRSLITEEWARHVPDVPYQQVC